MEQLKILKVVRRRYASIGISSTHQLAPKYSFNKRTVFGFLLYGYLIPAQIVYIFRVASGFIEYVQCLCSTSASVILFVCFATIVFKRTLLFANIDSIDEFISKRQKHPKSESFYLKSNQRVERFSEIMFTWVVEILVQCYMLPNCIVSLAGYFITDSGRDSFQLPFPIWFPLDWNSPIGYLIAVLLEYIIFRFDLFVTACTLCLGIGAFSFAMSVAKELLRILHSINNEAQATKKNQSNELRTLFTEYVHDHAAIKQVENDFSEIFQPIIMSLFTWSLLAISGGMLTIQAKLMRIENVLPVLVLIFSGIVALSIAFVVCELGQRMNDAFDEINDTINQLDWYLLPIGIKRMLPMIIAIAQQPVTLECFGSIACNREVFKNIIHCAYSYFTVLRQFDI